MVEKKSEQWVPQGVGQGRDMRELPGMMTMFFILIGFWVTQLHAFVKTL